MGCSSFFRSLNCCLPKKTRASKERTRQARSQTSSPPRSPRLTPSPTRSPRLAPSPARSSLRNSPIHSNYDESYGMPSNRNSNDYTVAMSSTPSLLTPSLRVSTPNSNVQTPKYNMPTPNYNVPTPTSFRGQPGQEARRIHSSKISALQLGSPRSSACMFRAESHVCTAACKANARTPEHRSGSSLVCPEGPRAGLPANFKPMRKTMRGNTKTA
jgi:hypothetical protein